MKSIFKFTLQVLDAPPDLDAIEDVFFEAGCDDTLLIQRGHSIFLSFSRLGDSLESAIQSAQRDIQTAGFQQTVLVSTEPASAVAA